MEPPEPPIKRTYEKNDDKIVFKPTPEDFEGFLNSGDVTWEKKGTTYTYRDLSSCIQANAWLYQCNHGFVTIKDPTGERTCQLDKITYYKFGDNYTIKQEWSGCSWG